MKKADVKIGGRYIAKVSGKTAVVRIVGLLSYGGWSAVNEITHRQIAIKSAQRLTERRPEFWVEYMDRMAAKRDRSARQ